MKKTKYLPLAQVTNLYAQFGKLSPKDKKIANQQTEEHRLLREKNQKKFVVEFDNRFDKAESQVFIAITGSPEQIVEKLHQLADTAKKYGKPIQENASSFKTESQVITPMWKGEPY